MLRIWIKSNKTKIWLFCILINLSATSFADLTGTYIGGGFGDGIQNLSNSSQGTSLNSAAVNAFVGYQFANWVGVEAGYTYLTQASSWNDYGSPSTTVYGLTVNPGFTLPTTPVSIYTRLGVDFVSSNLNTAWNNQIFSPLTPNFEWGLGVKLDVPGTQFFVRAEYINYGSAYANSNSSLSVNSSAILFNGAYVF